MSTFKTIRRTHRTVRSMARFLFEVGTIASDCGLWRIAVDAPTNDGFHFDLDRDVRTWCHIDATFLITLEKCVDGEWVRANDKLYDIEEACDALDRAADADAIIRNTVAADPDDLLLWLEAVDARLTDAGLPTIAGQCEA